MTHDSIMNDDVYPAAEKILSDIDAIFRKDPKLQNFEILPNEVSRNKSPVLHAEHTLGLEKWCIRHVYCHIYHRILYLRQHQHFRREDPEVLARLLLGAVLLNPNVTLLWNMRRELVMQGRQDPASELHLAAIALSRQPKTSEPFVYRRWLLERILAKPIEKRDVTQILHEELRVAQMAADRYPNNYHAWNHRMWTMSTITPKTDQASKMFITEWNASEEWISRHVSEFSGMQYRQTLISQLAESSDFTDPLMSLLSQAMKKFFTATNGVWCRNFENGSEEKWGDNVLQTILCDAPEDGENSQFTSSCKLNLDVSKLGLLAYDMILNSELIVMYPGHEALWSHRRFLLHSLRSVAKDIDLYFSKYSSVLDGIPVTKAQKLSENSKSGFQLGPVWTSAMCHEDELHEKCTVGTEDCHQRKLASKHKRWMNEILLR